MTVRSSKAIFFTVLTLFSVAAPIHGENLREPETKSPVKNFTKPVDLSYNVDEETTVWDTNVKYKRDKIIAGHYIPPDNHWYAENVFSLPEHIGTHLDAPYHFNEKGGKVADIPLELLFHVEGKG
uniref:Cyclase family protein n=1 Tax=Cacopsylla melanoneura TaxID=428564 RepID=A0A8D9E7V8_9HEMI